MSIPESNFSGIAAHYLASNIQRLESSPGCFVCFQCDANDWKGCWNPDVFQAHINSTHPDSEFLSCVFCGSDFPRDRLTSHIASHFASIDSRPFLYSCPMFVHSSCKFQTNNIHCLRIHLRSKHRNEPVVYRCPYCSKQEQSLESLESHVSTQALRLYHCVIYGCHVKSPSKQALVDHIIRKHGSILASSLRESVEFICEYQGTLPSYLRSFIVERSAPKASKRPGNPADCLALCLRCPKCHLATTDWSRFESHLNSCVTDPITYTIFWCPECSTVSTERGLIEEHALAQHETQSFRSPAASQQAAAEMNATIAAAAAAAGLRQATSNASSALDDPYLGHTALGHFGVAMRVFAKSTRSSCASACSSMVVETCYEAGTTLRESNEFVNAPSLDATLLNTVTPLTGQNPPINVISALTSLLPPPPPIQTSLAKTEMPSPKASTSTAPDVSLDNSFFSNNPFLAAAAMMSAISNFAINNPAPAPNILDNMAAAAAAIAADEESAAAEIGIDGDCHSNGFEGEANTPASSSNTAEEIMRTGPSGEEELVSFPFDEMQFRIELSGRVPPDVLDQLAEKLRKFSSYVIRILGKENHRRVPQCPECNRIFSYGLPDFKRHLLVIHLGAPREHLKDLLRFLRFPKVESMASEKQEQQAAMRQMRPSEIEPGVRKIPLPYSIDILRRLTDGLPEETRDHIAAKMRTYSTMAAICENKGGIKRYRCGHCQYSSPHALADVRKHILGSHCGISTKHFRFCLQASRLDHVDFCLLSDEKLDRLAQDFLTRRQPESVESEASSIEVNNNKRPHSRTPSPEASLLSREPDENGVSRFTTMIPGSKNPVKVRIRGPIPPGEPPTSPSHSSVLNTSNHPNSASIELSDLPKIPGLEGANQIVDLPLPYSKPVLRQLLKNAGALPHQIEEICAKMEVYSSKTMTRICQGDRTLAFRCSCGRLFVTTRQPDSKMRAATLADSRRHVMGVHARIPHEYITICCQASRISRENSFQLYPDEMLHRLAMDRPIKLNSPETLSASSHMHRVPSKSFSSKMGSLPPLRPLADLSADNSEDEKPIVNSRFNLPVAFQPLNDSTSNGIGGGGDERGEDSIDSEPIDTSVVLSCLNEQDPKEVERIIDLPYSKTALQVLVRGYCPQNYFNILLKKMQVYTNYKVFVTRRKGRRYFCCSGCSSVSPHGMGDIRKHILGVHAKVPERYKAAAMHCSRLSREDNTLLNDENLLQLAKMKWKGTVIKPLAEITMSGSFSSKPDPLGSSTPLSRYQRNSVNRLSDHASPVVLNATLQGKNYLYSCSACQVASEDSAAMRSHVAREHLGARACECPMCPDSFNSSTDLFTHCSTAHLNCIPTIPPPLLPAPYREAMLSASFLFFINPVQIWTSLFGDSADSVVINRQDTALPPSVVTKKEPVSMEDDEMGKLWTSWNSLNNSNDELDVPSTLFNLPSASVTPPLSSMEVNGDLASSSAVFPCPIPIPSTPSEVKPASNGAGSSRRKPLKANLVQLKQPKTTVTDPSAEGDEDEEGQAVMKVGNTEPQGGSDVPFKKPRLDEKVTEAVAGTQ
ncbi:hypothetical protein Aperf_G00000037154 [Anoplocephala perfoliata]